MSPATNPRPDIDGAVLGEALDALSDGIQVLSPEWRYLYVNQAAARQGRRAPAELVGRTMHECYPGIEKTAMFAALERCLAERRAETFENEFVFPDGSRAWFELRIRPCASGLVVVSLDVTQRKSVDDRLKDEYRRALRDLVTPVLRVHRGVLLVPLIGALDADRATQITETLLTRAVDEAAKVVILDIAGMPTIDTATAAHLLDAARMLRLLGANTMLSGIRAAVASAMVRLGLDVDEMETTGHLAEAVERAVARVRGAP